MSISTIRGVNELGADIIPILPDHLVCAVPCEAADVIKKQYEFVEIVEILDLKPNAFGGNIGDETVAGRGTSPEFDRGDTPHAITRAATKVEHAHIVQLQIGATAYGSASPRETYRMPIVSRLTNSLELSSNRKCMPGEQSTAPPRA